MAEKYKVNVELQIAMYDTLKRLINQHLFDYENYEKTKDSLSIEEKKAICDKEQKLVGDFYALRDYYMKYKNNPTAEFELIIKKKFSALLNSKPKKSDDSEVIEKTILDSKDDSEELIEKPVLDFDDEEYMTIDDWCKHFGYILHNNKGFTKEQLLPGTKISAQEFFAGAAHSDCEEIDFMKELSL